jgi:hypothetical protein
MREGEQRRSCGEGQLEIAAEPSCWRHPAKADFAEFGAAALSAANLPR